MGNPVRGYPLVVLTVVAVSVEDDFGNSSRDGREQYDERHSESPLVE
ncbi:MAG: hypothetical protein QJT81_05655 [Candidatus Thiothrix putei]|uniref:Uncharacterized protein n=1 Tax=Candidatus Thiothrix putei TaxID=3080811 RepID=A0AA95HDK6_9GAMM|nr:MAG: hypothetical protein QJT81_05655 [Candidatus Thiothrix putei]